MEVIRREKALTVPRSQVKPGEAFDCIGAVRVAVEAGTMFRAEDRDKFWGLDLETGELRFLQGETSVTPLPDAVVNVEGRA